MNKVNTPKISILCPSYNHEKYVSYFIESVLYQTEKDFELIIVDDCSSDRNIEVINRYTDSRIKLIRHEYNKGINSGLNTAFSYSKGKYCVFIASDDILEPNHLQVISDYLDKNLDVGAFYCSYSNINISNQVVGESIQPNMKLNRYELLYKAFMFGNIFMSPGMTIRRELFNKFYPLNNSLVQSQDYQIHINILLLSDVHISKQKLVKYRSSGISKKSFFVDKRIELETDKVMDTFLKIKDIDLFKNIFNKDINKVEKVSINTIPFFLGIMAVDSIDESRKRWGYQTIMKFIDNEENYTFLNKNMLFYFKDYIALSRNFINIFKILKIFISLLLIYVIISIIIILNLM